mgnify:CR=1 FL=1
MLYSWLETGLYCVHVLLSKMSNITVIDEVSLLFVFLSFNYHSDSSMDRIVELGPISSSLPAPPASPPDSEDPFASLLPSPPVTVGFPERLQRVLQSYQSIFILDRKLFSLAQRLQSAAVESALQQHSSDGDQSQELLNEIDSVITQMRSHQVWLSVLYSDSFTVSYTNSLSICLSSSPCIQNLKS